MQRLIDVSHLKDKARRAQIYNRVQNYNAYVVLVSDIDNAPTIDPSPKWIPVTERLPEREKDVLVYDADNDEMHVWAFFCDADGDGWVDAAGNMRPWLDATHWMPLPKPPEDGGAENA